MKRAPTHISVLSLVLLLACESEEAMPAPEGGTTSTPATTSTSGEEGGSTAGDGSSSGSAETTTGSSSSDGDSTSASSGSTGDEPVVETDARGWIIEHFADDPTMMGDFDARTLVEVPRLVLDSTGGNAKYAFTPRNEEGPEDKRVGFVGVSITDLVSPDAYGGGIATSNDDPGVIMYLDDVYIEPNWPSWVDYQTTNYDGIVLDAVAEVYGEDITIVNWNADSAVDNKSPISQFVRLTTQGEGNRTIRYWRTGPHYLVESSLENPGGTILWFSNCDDTTLYVYESTFDGAPTVPAESISCDEGTTPNIVYLDVDPRTTGEMHPMFSWPLR